MNQKIFNLTTGTIFLIIGILHFLRVLNSWPVNIGIFTVPMWLSWIAVALAGYLAYHGLKRRVY